jgi:ribonuclease BN (tRNA processing enzyme)
MDTGMLSFTFLGTGAPPVSARRAGPAHLVEAAGQLVLIDCGSRVAHQLAEAGKPAAAIDALIVTHLHSDHIVDFYQLVISSWHQGRDRPWRVIAPEPALKAMKAQYAAFDDERRLRIAFEKRPSARGLEVVFEALEPGSLSGFGDLSVNAFLVDHHPVAPAFGLAFASDASRLVFSGDTRPCAALDEAASGADLLVCEVYADSQMPIVSGVRSAETVAAVRSYHMVPSEIARLANLSGAKAVALTHVVPPSADTQAVLAEIRAAGYPGPVMVGEDLATLVLPARMLRWRGLAASF